MKPNAAKPQTTLEPNQIPLHALSRRQDRIERLDYAGAGREGAHQRTLLDPSQVSLRREGWTTPERQRRLQMGIFAGARGSGW
jgi:hypothetical protein